MRDSHVEVDVGVRQGAGGFARERFIEGVQGGIVVASRVECESEVAVGLGVGGIHTEGGARFGQGLVGIFGPVKQVRELAVGFRKTGHQARRFREGIERFVEPALPAQNGSEDKLQQCIIRQSTTSKSAVRRSIARIVAKQGADLVFGSVEFLVVNQSGNLCRWTGAGAGGAGGWLSVAILIRTPV